jgi:hypothetical protein
MHSFNTVCNLVNSVKLVCDEVIDGQVALQVFTHQLWDLCAGLEASEGSALPLPTGNELEGSSGDLLT